MQSLDLRRCLNAPFLAIAVLLAGRLPARAARMVAGVNLAGLEYGATHLPGVLNFDYVVPTTAELKYYHGKGIKLVRLPVLWERLQPGLFGSKPGTAFSPQYLALIQGVLRQAAARGMKVVIDVHDYGGYAGHKLGTSQLQPCLFGAFWQHLASRLAATRGLAGYDLMNEPNTMPNPAAWPAAAQAAVTAIRTVDMKTPIYVEGDSWAAASAWVSVNNALNIHDPASHLVYEAHVYGDRDASGSHDDWVAEAAHGVTVQTIAQRVAIFSGWCAAGQHVCMIGEIGVGNDNPNWETELANGLAAMQAGGIQSFAYWAGGPWWGNYPMSIEPTAKDDAVQMGVVRRYAR